MYLHFSEDCLSRIASQPSEVYRNGKNKRQAACVKPYPVAACRLALARNGC